MPDPSEWPGLLAPSAALAPRLRQIRALVDQDADLLAQPLRLAALEVQLQGLQVMEARAVRPSQEREKEGESSDDTDFSATPSAMVAVLAERLGWAVAEIEHDVLGYFGLPVNDPMMQHNEGPIAPEPLANVAAKRTETAQRPEK